MTRSWLSNGLVAGLVDGGRLVVVAEDPGDQVALGAGQAAPRGPPARRRPGEQERRAARRRTCCPRAGPWRQQHPVAGDDDHDPEQRPRATPRDHPEQRRRCSTAERTQRAAADGRQVHAPADEQQEHDEGRPRRACGDRPRGSPSRGRRHRETVRPSARAEAAAVAACPRPVARGRIGAGGRRGHRSPVVRRSTQLHSAMSHQWPPGRSLEHPRPAERARHGGAGAPGGGAPGELGRIGAYPACDTGRWLRQRRLRSRRSRSRRSPMSQTSPYAARPRPSSSRSSPRTSTGTSGWPRSGTRTTTSRGAEGRDFAFLGGEDWAPEDSPLDPVAKTAMVVNLLTEDNLPVLPPRDRHPLRPRRRVGQWVGRWTAEEGRHGIAMRDYLVVTRGVDPVELERARMEHMTAGYDSGDKTAAAGASPTCRSRSWRPGSRTATPARPPATRSPSSCSPGSPPTRTCTWSSTATWWRRRFDIDPGRDDAGDRATRSSASRCPAPGMADFRRNSMIIAKAGIYDLRLHHDEVISPVLRTWKVFERTDFGAGGRAGARGAGRSSSSGSTRRRRGSWRAASGCAPAWQRGIRSTVQV